ncbi:MAG TPA: nucleotidyltransferase domain-containing protein [Deltaproteobacteria bacterium]|nr:nucleotidyltransferase domain-containing protein [Deltaproteobacteria bacterium]
MPTALEMKPEEWRKFKPGRKVATRAAQSKYLKKRRAKGLELAKKASLLLRQRYGAKRVVLFGSLARTKTFSSWSDIDLAAWGIAPDKFFSAVAAVTGLSPDFRIDLVEPDTCREAMKDSIQKHGIEI